MTISFDLENVEHELSAQQQQRLDRGQCHFCGQQLYGFERQKGIFLLLVCCKNRKNAFRKVPLTVPQLVERGQCLQCDSHKTSKTPETQDSGSATSTTDGDLLCAGMEHSYHDLDKLSPKRPSDTAANIGSPPSSFTTTSLDGKHQNSTRALLSLGVPFPSPAQHRSRLARLQVPALGEANTATYDGRYNSKGEKHGEGKMTWSNGDVYKGNFTNDRRSGHGVLTFAGSDSQQDSGEYVGEWSNDQMHGSGTRRYPNGDVYVGNYVEGKRQGEGRFYFANGDLYFGDWENNHMHGSGLYYFSSGVRFEGTFLYNKRNGKGKTQNESGSIDIFQYINDERVGKGVRFNAKRTQAWQLAQRHDGAYRQNGSAPLERHRITIAEAVSLVYEIEQAAQSSNEDLISSRLPN